MKTQKFISKTLLRSALFLSPLLVSNLALADAADGKRVYGRLCANCHGSDGSGNPEMARTLKVDAKLLNLGRDEAAGIGADQKRATLLKGKDKMPAYEAKLKPEQVDPVFNYTAELTAALRKK